MNDKPCKNCGSCDRAKPKAGRKTGRCKGCERQSYLRRLETRPDYYAGQERRQSDANPKAFMIRNAKKRAIKKGVVFNLHPDDFDIPAVCPVLGILLERNTPGLRGGSPNSPSLDRIVPALGYVAGNVRVISWRANSLKKDATPEEMALLAEDMNRVSRLFMRAA